jgi:hypothetical protein
MKRTFAVIGLLAAVGVLALALLSGKPNETPKQLPETTPPSQQR